MDLCDDVDTHLARTIPRICATYKFDAQIHGNVRRCGAGFKLARILFLNQEDADSCSDLQVQATTLHPCVQGGCKFVLQQLPQGLYSFR